MSHFRLATKSANVEQLRLDETLRESGEHEDGRRGNQNGTWYKNDPDEFLIFSDNLLFVKAENNLTFTGNVKIQFHDLLLQTNRVFLQIGKNKKLEKIIIPNAFKAINRDTVIMGKYAEYNAQTSILKLENGVSILNKENIILSQTIVYKTKLNYIKYAK